MKAKRSKIYVLQPTALQILAGDDPALRNANGEPNLTAISIAAELDATTLLQIRSGKIGLSSWVMAALVDFLMRRSYTHAKAHAALFALVDNDGARDTSTAVAA